MWAALKRHRVLAGILTLVVAIAVGVGGWWFFVRNDPDRDCAGLRTDAGVRTTLGPDWRADLPCGELADGLRRATTGDRPGVHTVEQANAMLTIVKALGKREDHHVHPAVRRPLAEALADYAADTHVMLAGPNFAYGEHERGGDGAAWQDEKGVHFVVYDLLLLRAMRGLSEDPTAYAVLRTADLRKAAEGFAAIGANVTESEVRYRAIAAALPAGGFDAIADDVLHRRDTGSGRTWLTTARARLQAEKASPAPDFATDRAGALTAGSLAKLSAAAPDGYDGLLPWSSQTQDLLTAWAEASHASLSPSFLESLRTEASASTQTGRTKPTVNHPRPW
ncbi:hypothetical protein [Kitasatospora sp. NPDC093102]|uniref:hypothetical protein n=1 Tax=Kitasatospora sp. NPDC093102 TaxID=3155069 RepID=UPI0034314501